jgi:hypothetical protein
LEVVLETGPASQTIVALSTIVEQYLRDLRDTLGNDTDRARVLLAKMVGTVTLRRQGEDLIGEVRGNLRGLLHMEDEERFGSDGAGRGIPTSNARGLAGARGAGSVKVYADPRGASVGV